VITLTDIGFMGPGLPIDGYGPGFFRIGGKAYQGAVIVAPDGISLWAGLGDQAALTALAGRIDVLFLGLGRSIGHAAPDLRTSIEGLGIGLEAMDSPAAARSYNICLSEGRRVAAALIPV
jgi:uncharacterized protein